MPVKGDDLKAAALLVDGNQADVAFTGCGELQPGDASDGALLEMCEHTLHEGMSGSEEVQQLVFDSPLAIEGADECGAARDTGEAIDQRLMTKLERVCASAARSFDPETEP